MSSRAVATFQVTGWEQTPYAQDRPGPALSRATVRKKFSGDFEGELQGRAGSFVVQHVGVSGDGQRSFGHGLG